MAKNKEDMKKLLNTFTGVEKSDESEIEPKVTLNDQKPDIIDTIDDEELKEAIIKKRNNMAGKTRKYPDGKRTDGYSRFTFVANIEKMAKVKEIAFTKSLTQKEVLEAALDLLIEKYEAKHGEIIPNPEGHKGNVNNIFD